MSIDSISGGSSAAAAITAQQQNPKGKIGQDFQALSKALSSVDLAGAKTAFATMQADMKSRGGKKNDGDADDNGAGTGSATGSNSSTNPLQALAAALQSGDIESAQSALSQMQSGHGHHHHHQKTASVPDPSGTTGQNVDVQA